MPFYTGSGASLQIGKETAFAQGASPTALVDITSEALKLSVEKGDEGSLISSKTAQTRDLMSINVGGSINFILRPEFAGLLLHLALGGKDECVKVAETDKYTHTLKLCDVNENLPSLTIVVDRKAAIKKYLGCSISNLTLDCAAGDYVKGAIEIKGVKEEVGTLNKAIATFGIPSYRCTSATFTIGGVTYDISSASFKVDNALEEAPKTYASGLYSGQPQHGKRSVSMSFEIPYCTEVEDLKSSYLTTEVNSSIVLTFASSNLDYNIQITIPNFAINDVDAAVGGTGILTSSVQGEALSVALTEPLTVVLTDKTPTPYGE